MFIFEESSILSMLILSAMHQCKQKLCAIKPVKMGYSQRSAEAVQVAHCSAPVGHTQAQLGPDSPAQVPWRAGYPCPLGTGKREEEENEVVKEVEQETEKIRGVNSRRQGKLEEKEGRELGE